MKVEDVKVCVLLMEGTNCEEESYLSFSRLGAKPEKVHINQLVSGEKKLRDYHLLFFPGGFSSGDYIRAGAIFAARLKSKFQDEIRDFVADGYPVLGICNGFQVLVEVGLLPGFEHIMSPEPEAVLTNNDSNKFECRPSLLKHENGGKCVFTKNIPKGKVLTIPSAHAEGKFLLPLDKQKELLDKLIEQDQIVFRYVDPDGNYAGYPWNPNGSIYNIAGICNRQGNVLGMMPHPERVFYGWTHPDWTRKGLEEEGDGRAMFKSVLEYLTEKF